LIDLMKHNKRINQTEISPGCHCKLRNAAGYSIREALCASQHQRSVERKKSAPTDAGRYALKEELEPYIC